jgi:hypothetical protein
MADRQSHEVNLDKSKRHGDRVFSQSSNRVLSPMTPKTLSRQSPCCDGDEKSAMREESFTSIEPVNHEYSLKNRPSRFCPRLVWNSLLQCNASFNKKSTYSIERDYCQGFLNV